MKTLALVIAIVFAILCPTLSQVQAADVSTSFKIRLAALTLGSKMLGPKMLGPKMLGSKTLGSQNKKRMTPRPGVMAEDCTPENVRCTSDEECCEDMFCDCPTGSACLCRYEQ